MEFKSIFEIMEEEKPTKLPSIFDIMKEMKVVAPPAPEDMAKIMPKPAKEVPIKPVMGLEYIPAKVASYLVVEPIANASALIADLLAKGFDKLGSPRMAEQFTQSAEFWKKLPFIEKVKEQTAYLREQAYKGSQATGIIFDVSEATTRLGALLVQIGTLGKVPSLKDVPRFKTMFGHAFVTTEGDVSDRLKAAVTRVGYSITPFIAQHWGATGIKSVAIDTALNTFLTSPTYVAAFKQAQKTGKWDEFLSTAVTQFTMDVGMALATQGYPAAQRKVAITKYLKTHPESKLTPEEFTNVLDSFWKAQGDAIVVVKGEAPVIAKVTLREAKASLMKDGVSKNTLDKLTPDSVKDLYEARMRKIGKAIVPPISKVEKAKIEEVPPEVEKLPEGVTFEAKLPEVPTKELVAPSGVTISEISKAEGPIMARIVRRLWESGVQTLESNMGGKGTYPALQRTAYTKTHTYIDVARKLDAKTVKELRKAGFIVKLKRAQIEVGVDDWDWEEIHEISFRAPTGGTKWVDSINKARLNKMADILIKHKLPPIEKPGVPTEKPRVTRQEFVDRLTKKDAEEAPIVKALEDAKAKPSEEAEATLRTVVESPPTREQLTRIKFLVGQKGLLTPTGKQKAQHKAFLKALTGEESITKMNQGQIHLVIETLEGWHPKTVRAVYETPVKFITKDLIGQLQGFREIGFVEDFRDAYHVWQRIGLVRQIYEATEKAEVDLVERIEADTKVALQYEKLTKDIPNTFGRVFRLLNNTPTKEDVPYTKEELETVKWLKTHFDKWADDLDLPPGKRRKHYITNIIEDAVVKDLKKNELLNSDFLRAMEYGPGAKEIFHPYLKERKGVWQGVKEDWRTAFDAYEGYSARKLFYDPILQKINLISKFLPPNATRYAKEYTKRMSGELSDTDKRLNVNLAEMGEIFAKLPGGKGFAEFLTRGNPAGTISYHAAGLLYVSYLGLMPRSAIRNASQSVLTIAEVGGKAFLKGGEFLRTPEGKKALKECTILRQRRFAALPGLDISQLRGKLKTVEDAALYLFKFPDIKFSVPRAFGAGFVEARDLGLPRELCIRRGNEVARKCQYAYSGMASSLIAQSSVGRVLGVFTTWPRNFVELGMEWMKGKPSQVYKDYKEATGIDVIPQSGTAKRAALLRYISIVALASVLERKTAFRATEYTGWTSLKNIPRILAGDLAGIQVPAGAVDVLIGLADYASTGDPYQMKKGWNAIRPDKQVLLWKNLTDVFAGKKDWMDLLLYLEKGEGRKKYPRLKRL